MLLRHLHASVVPSQMWTSRSAPASALESENNSRASLPRWEFKEQLELRTDNREGNQQLQNQPRWDVFRLWIRPQQVWTHSTGILI